MDTFKLKPSHGGVPKEVWKKACEAGFGQARKIIKEYRIEVKEEEKAERLRIKQEERLELERIRAEKRAAKEADKLTRKKK